MEKSICLLKLFDLVLDAFFFSFFFQCLSLLLLLLLKVHSAATSLAADLLKYHTDHMVLKALKITGVEGNLEAVAEYTCKLSEQKEQLVEVGSRLLSLCKALRKEVAAFVLLCSLRRLWSVFFVIFILYS